ncbi:MAG: AsnC family transcriptional regulator [Methanosarcinales archaeon Met12]|nr:MAG: AsnC family transcriptional regulator [Methanosarcinales archaeon Met12]
MDEVDKAILNIIQVRFPLTRRPFDEVGRGLGISGEEAISRVKRLKTAGAIRHIGPIIDMKKLGGSSTLIAMNTPSERVDEVAAIINEYSEVSHNYLRPNKYNIWFTVSASSKERLDQILGEIKDKTGCECLNLPVVKMFKLGVQFDI